MAAGDVASSVGGFSVTDDGIRVPERGVRHRADEYLEEGFTNLAAMQAQHFWYRGRHRYVHRAVARAAPQDRTLDAIDLGGGCGGWVRYLASKRGPRFGELAHSDSSLVALRHAREVVPPGTVLYQADLLDLPWERRWDLTFLLDVIEHIDDDVRVMQEVRKSLRPGGLAVVTVPALRAFWSYNDDLVLHKRRYSKADFRELAHAAGLELVHASYFMFLLSPLLVVSRWFGPKLPLSQEEARQLLRRTHRVPSAPVNEAFAAVFAAETPLGQWVPFPWGTSLLGVFRRPAGG